MGMQVNTNIAANNAYRNLATTQNDLSKSLEKLSSGLRINRAADDAAGLAISEGLKSQVGGLTVASRNAQDAISVIQTAEGSLNEATSILQRMRDLAVQAGNDSNSIESRAAITTEATALTKELTRIGSSTNFNGTDLLKGGSMSFQIGANSGDSISVDLADVASVATSLANTPARTTWALSDSNAALVTGVQTFTVANADSSSTTVTTTGLGAAGTFANVTQYVAALNADAEFSSNLKASVVSGALVVESTSGGTVGTAVPSSAGFATGTATAAVAGTSSLDFSSATGAAAAIVTLTSKIESISSERADLGAQQNRFESVIKNLAVSKENLTAAGSRIRDTDMAEEMVKYTRANILSQAGTAMLAQANQSNSGVLQLLQ